MATKILISRPNIESLNKIQEILTEENFEVDSVQTGKDVQLHVYKNKYQAVILDLYTENYSCFEVVKYIRVTSPFVKVIIIVESENKIKELELDEKTLKKMGVAEVICDPLNKDKLLKAINGEMQFKMWKKATAEKGIGKEEEISARDEEFTRIKLVEFLGGNSVVFDIYIRLNENKYLKILHAGESFDEERINLYKLKHNIEYLFFRTKDRSVYIHYVNSYLAKIIETDALKPKGNPHVKVKIVKNLIEKFVEEVYTQGLKSELVQEGALACENITKIIQQNKGLSKSLREFEDFDPSAYHHSFLVSFFASIICSHLDWATEVTMQKIIMGSMFHDIGKLKLNKSFALLRPREMKPDQLEMYKLHPQYGVELMNIQPLISESIKQIIYQHHERIDGSGFPRGITGIKIYPLAQVLGFCDEFSHIMVDNKVNPVQALKMVLQNRELVTKFAPSILRSLAESFVDKQTE